MTAVSLVVLVALVVVFLLPRPRQIAEGIAIPLMILGLPVLGVLAALEVGGVGGMAHLLWAFGVPGALWMVGRFELSVVPSEAELPDVALDAVRAIESAGLSLLVIAKWRGPSYVMVFEWPAGGGGGGAAPAGGGGVGGSGVFIEPAFGCEPAACLAGSGTR